MMATADACKEVSFTFLWTIENVPKVTPINLKSPRFVAESIRKDKSYLQIIENEVFENEENRFCCWLRVGRRPTHTNDEVENLPQEIPSIAFEFSILAEDGSILISKTSEKSRFYVDLLPSAAFSERRDEFIRNDKMTVQFRMWKKDCEVSNRDFCFGRTKLMTYKKSFVWAIKEFSALRAIAAEDVGNLASTNIRLHPLKPLWSMWPPMALILYLKRTNEIENVNVDFSIGKGRSHSFGSEISILDGNGKVIASKEKTGNMDQDLKFSLISRNELMANKNLLLPNDCLLVRCYLEIPFGDISGKIEYGSENVTLGVPTTFDASLLGADLRFAAENNPLEFEDYHIHKINDNDTPNIDAENSESEDEEDPFWDNVCMVPCSPMVVKSIPDSCKDSCKLKTALKYLKNDTTMSDINLKIGTKVFPAHRNILCSRSIQFEKILNYDKVKTTIEIKDMDENILCCLLQYIYSNTVEDPGYANALDLYKAADHYQMLDLRKKCSFILGNNLRKADLCEILSLSKKCQDEELEEKVQVEERFRKLRSPTKFAEIFNSPEVSDFLKLISE